MTIRLPLLCGVALVLAACAVGQPVSPDGPDPARAERLAHEGRYAEAAEIWQALARARPEAAAEFQLHALEAWLAGGQPAPAMGLIEALQGAELDDLEQLRLNLARAESALLQGDWTGAERLLNQSAQMAVPDPGNAQAQRRLALEQRLRTARPDPASLALDRLSAALADGRFTPEMALAELVGLPLRALRGLAAVHADDPRLSPWLELAAAAGTHVLDPERLEAALEAWQASYPQVGYSAAEAQAWLEAWRAQFRAPESIAVMLPASGNLAAAGRSVRDGLMSRWLELPPASRPQLRFYPVDDRPESALAAWFQLREDGAELLIGPLDRGQVDALLELPDAGIPMLLLNQPDRVTISDAGDAVWVLALPPEEEAELAAIHALVRGHTRALVIAPSNRWGQRLAERFEETLRLGGGRVVARAEYPTGRADHSEMLEVLLELDRSDARIQQLAATLGQAVEAERQRRTDADLVFLAARSGDARAIKPQLRFFDAADLPTYSTSAAFSGNRADHDLDGIELAAAPWLVDATWQGQRRGQIENLFDSLGNPSSSVLFALGRDAISLAAWLPQLQADPELVLGGAVGRLRLADGQRFERDLPWTRISQGRLLIE